MTLGYGGCVRYFNTKGPRDPQRHYTLPAVARLRRPEPLIERGRYFAVHAPRQTGKTTTMGAPARQLTTAGGHVALRFPCEGGEAWGNDISEQGQSLISVLRQLRDGFSCTPHAFPRSVVLCGMRDPKPCGEHPNARKGSRGWSTPSTAGPSTRRASAAIADPCPRTRGSEDSQCWPAVRPEPTV